MQHQDREEQVNAIIMLLRENQIAAGIEVLKALKDEIYTAIPEKQRQSRGITWVIRQISMVIVQACKENLDQVKHIAQLLHEHLAADDLLQGVPIFLMAAYGEQHPRQVYKYFENLAGSDNWVVREFAAAGFHKVIAAQSEVVRPWLMETARSGDPNVRRFVSEALRPVTDLRWINQQPRYSLDVLRLLFREENPYPRTSVGNNLSDLSRRNPELILSVVAELIALDDKNSTWIAHRACRNLVKKYPERVLDLLGSDEYHYKDRHYYRE